MTDLDVTELVLKAANMDRLLRDVAANLRTHLPKLSKHKTLRAWAMAKRDHPSPQTQREAETTLAILDLLGED